jgi:GTP-binding protein HflX
VDASNPQAEDHIRAVNAVLKELECDQKPTILVLNKIDRVTDRSTLQVLEAHHPRAVAVSGLTGEGIDKLEDAVMEALAAEFAEAEVVADAGNGKVLAFLNAHSEVYRQEFRDESNEVVIRCHLPRHLLHHIAGPTVKVRFIERLPKAPSAPTTLG